MVAIDRQTTSAILSSVCAATRGDNVPMPSTTELDSHANMVVVGRQASIISESGIHAEVKPFSDDCGTLERIPIVDAAIGYDCPTTSKTYILIVRNALYVKSMDHNLIPPFVMREAGLQVNDVPRIHCGNDITQDSHCIVANGETHLRIPLRLRGIFSFFPSRALEPSEIENCEEMDCVCLTPEGREWDPNTSFWDDEEAKFLNQSGELIWPPPPKRRKLLIPDDPDWLEINRPQSWVAIRLVAGRQGSNSDTTSLRSSASSLKNRRTSSWIIEGRRE